jgi:hypothetical protein
MKVILGSAVGTMPKLRAGQSEFRITFRERDFYRLQNVLKDIEAQPASSTRNKVVLSPVGAEGEAATHFHFVPRL